MYYSWAHSYDNWNREVEMNLLEDLTVEVQNIWDKWLQRIAETYVVAESECSPRFSDTEKRLKKFHDEIPSETNAYGDRGTSVEESFIRNVIVTTLYFIVNYLESRLRPRPLVINPLIAIDRSIAATS
jgi:hypothetical protein